MRVLTVPVSWVQKWVTIPPVARSTYDSPSFNCELHPHVILRTSPVVFVHLWEWQSSLLAEWSYKNHNFNFAQGPVMTLSVPLEELQQKKHITQVLGSVIWYNCSCREGLGTRGESYHLGAGFRNMSQLLLRERFRQMRRVILPSSLASVYVTVPSVGWAQAGN